MNNWLNVKLAWEYVFGFKAVKGLLFRRVAAAPFRTMWAGSQLTASPWLWLIWHSRSKARSSWARRSWWGFARDKAVGGLWHCRELWNAGPPLCSFVSNRKWPHLRGIGGQSASERDPLWAPFDIWEEFIIRIWDVFVVENNWIGLGWWLTKMCFPERKYPYK